MGPLRRCSLGLSWAVLLHAWGAGSVAAQGVSGTVREGSTSAPLAGVLVSAVSSDGTRLSAVLTDSVGRFVVRLPRAGRVRLQAERIGLETATTEWLDLLSSELRRQDIVMRSVAVELEGLVVLAPVQNCQVNRLDGARIQRWWDEARKALDVTSVVQSRNLVRFRIYQFEREWTANLRSLLREDGRRTTAYSSQPFTSVGPEALERDGYIQGEAGRRLYYAPDAAVLLSSSFLDTHCFSLATDPDRPHWIGLRFQPTRTRKVVDILGTFWVDTTTSELKALEYLYANLPSDIPGEQAGGRVEFRYLPSGAWIVPQWWVRAPRVGVRTERVGALSRDVAEVVGYVDMGGRAEEVDTQVGSLDGVSGWGRIEGSVYDSLAGRPLGGARVHISGTRFSALTAADGSFALDSIPAGTHSLTFFHGSLAGMGWPSPVVGVSVASDSTARSHLAVPPFRGMAQALCPGLAARLEAILVGRILDSAGESFAQGLVQARWERGDPLAGLSREIRSESYTGSDGRYVFCGLPADLPLQVRVRVGDRWQEVLDLVLPTGQVVTREVRLRNSP
ncbi:MAG: carboxypeptidase regulatory-like domain-containing protein [Longimicrobiales bacterium]|nr:carboxypeptidase regulatory-like domain-containing protein [Longimicrobiales bacterium]